MERWDVRAGRMGSAGVSACIGHDCSLPRRLVAVSRLGGANTVIRSAVCVPHGVLPEQGSRSVKGSASSAVSSELLMYRRVYCQHALWTLTRREGPCKLCAVSSLLQPRRLLFRAQLRSAPVLGRCPRLTRPLHR